MSKGDETILFIITGGTIDSHFNPAKDTTTIGEKTSIKDYIKKLQLHNDSKFDVVALKDSRDINEEDRKKILEAIKKSPHEMIVVTHGTYTMAATGQFLKDNLKDNKKTIVLTGSVIPLKGFELSDAGFNLGYAVAKVQELSPGIYVCMNGKVFDPEKVDKNRLIARFEEMD